MTARDRAIGSTLVVLAGVLGAFGASSTASAQQTRPRIGAAAQPAPVPSQITTPYPGATVTVDPRLYQRQSLPPQIHRRRRSAPVVYYVPVPSGYSYYPSGGYGGGVTDANGRPLTSFDEPAPMEYGYGLGTPDLSGSPYVAVEGGAMVVDFGNGDMRTIPSCAAQSSERAPDGQPRTIFYRPDANGVVLRAGQRGRVIGTPGAGARVCYTTDSYGRMVLDY